MTITLPSRFARINRWIHTPAWGPLASHDVPFADGLSGTAMLTVTAKSPLLVGGLRRKATKATKTTEAKRGEVWPFCLPDGTWALPPAGVQGLCRSILEIAGFGRLGRFIEDRRFGIRDLGNSGTAKTHYRKHLVKQRYDRAAGLQVFTPRTKAGWLIQQNGQTKLVHCELSRVHVNDLDRLAYRLRGGSPDSEPDAFPLNRNDTEPSERYGMFLHGLSGKDCLDQEFSVDPVTDHRHIRTTTRDGNATEVEYRIRESYCKPAILTSKVQGQVSGSIVITGKIATNGDEMGEGQKKREFVFHSPNRAEVLDTMQAKPNRVFDVEPKVLEAFFYLHCDARGKPENDGWAYWADDFKHDKPVPVFWWADNDEKPTRVENFGMAAAFKAAFPLSAHDMLRNSAAGHLPESDDVKPDLPDLIFGCAAEKGKGLKRRAWFGVGALVEHGHDLDRYEEAILGSPKPGYYPTTVRQRRTPDNRIPRDEAMSAFARDLNGTESAQNPELAGVRVWPAATRKSWSVASPQQENLNDAGESVKADLHTLPVGTTFRVPLTFHNLRPVELGALLWALSFGDMRAFGKAQAGQTKHRLRHRLGMGKPFGFGEVQIDVDTVQIDQLEGNSSTDPKALIDAFTSHMSAAYEGQQRKDWSRSPQLQALLQAADPMRNNPVELRYMSVAAYRNAKDRQHFLGPYVADESHEILRPNEAANPPLPAEPVQRPEKNSGVAQPRPTAEQRNVAKNKIEVLDGVRVGDRVQLHASVPLLGTPKPGLRHPWTGSVVAIDPDLNNPYRLDILIHGSWFKKSEFVVLPTRRS